MDSVVIPPHLFDDKIKKTIESDEKSDKSEDEERPDDFEYDNVSQERKSAGSPAAIKEIDEEEKGDKCEQVIARSKGNTPKPIGLNSKRLKALNQNSKSIETDQRFRQNMRSPKVDNKSVERDQVSIQYTQQTEMDKIFETKSVAPSLKSVAQTQRSSRNMNNETNQLKRITKETLQKLNASQKSRQEGDVRSR